jgi:hypothetical protein
VAIESPHLLDARGLRVCDEDKRQITASQRVRHLFGAFSKATKHAVQIHDKPGQLIE